MSSGNNQERIEQVEFKKVERQCAYNAKVHSGSMRGRLIYDHQVFIDGRHVGHFSSRPASRNMDLHSLSGDIWFDCTTGARNRFMCQRQADMESTVRDAIRLCAIFPTQDQIEQKKEQMRQEIREDAMNSAKRSQAGAMFALLVELSETIQLPQFEEIKLRIDAAAGETISYQFRSQGLGE